MNLTFQIAKHLRDVHFGGNWTWVNLRDTLADVNWKQATTKIDSLNTIALLVFHMNYYVSTILKVIQGQSLNAHDKYSFELGSLNSEEDWQQLMNKSFTEAQVLATAIEQLPQEKLNDIFFEEKYGSYLRNFLGLIEHCHYHLGQIVIIKKMVRQPTV